MFEILGEKFGYETNSKGYRVLPPCVRVIQGDGVNMFTIQNMLYQLSKFHGWSADNLAFGMGGALLQQLNRDTQKFAFKCSAAELNGKWQAVFKDPVTDAENIRSTDAWPSFKPSPGNSVRWKTSKVPN